MLQLQVDESITQTMAGKGELHMIDKNRDALGLMSMQAHLSGFDLRKFWKPAIQRTAGQHIIGCRW